MTSSVKLVSLKRHQDNIEGAIALLMRADTNRIVKELLLEFQEELKRIKRDIEKLIDNDVNNSVNDNNGVIL